VAAGKVNWVPKAGSLALRFFLEEIGEEGINKVLCIFLDDACYYPLMGTGLLEHVHRMRC
jgi:hypothetical protein